MTDGAKKWGVGFGFLKKGIAELRSEDLLEIFGAGGLRGAHVVMCGPEAMVRDMSNAARELGARRVHVEGFDIRTGIGPDLSREIASLREYSR